MYKIIKIGSYSDVIGLDKWRKRFFLSWSNIESILEEMEFS